MHMVFFDFKAIGPGKRGGYRGGIIKNHQKTTSKGGSTTPYIPPFKRAIMIYFKGGMGTGCVESILREEWVRARVDLIAPYRLVFMSNHR